MLNLNRIVLAGKLTDDPKATVVGQKRVYSFRVAVVEGYKGQQGWTEHVGYFDVKYWAPLSAVFQAVKGTNVYVEGRLKTESWEDKKTNEKKYKTLVDAVRIIPLDGIPGSDETTQIQPEESQQEIPF